MTMQPSGFQQQSARHRLDVYLAEHKLVTSRSQAESWVRMGKVTVNGVVVKKPGFAIHDGDTVKLLAEEQYVSRAALKLKSADQQFKIDFRGKIMLDVGSSTGGFTEYALRHGAEKVIAVDVGTDQLHPSLRTDGRIELHEKTDIRDVVLAGRQGNTRQVVLTDIVNIVVCDVSFISLREILPHVAKIAPAATVIAMVKPQFEARHSNITHKGVIKNDTMRRKVLKDFEMWVQKLYKIVDKHDSDVAGAKGNVERFYRLHTLGK